MLINAKFKDVIFRTLAKDGRRYLILTGGRGSGKSYVVNNLLIHRILKDWDETMLVTRYTLAGVRNGLLPSIKSIAMHYPQLTITNTYCNNITSRIIFDGIKSSSPSKLKSIDNLSLFSCDEASDIMSEDEFDLIDQSIRSKHKDGLTILILNPTSPDHWIYKKFFKNISYDTIKINNKTFHYPVIKDENILHVHTTFLDNIQNLSKSFINIAKKCYEENTYKFSNQFLGIWTEMKGNKVFNCSNGIIYRDYPCAIGVDFGYYPDPTAIVKVYLNQTDKKIYVQELLYEHNLSAEQLRNELLLYRDYDIVADTNAKAITEPLKMLGLNIFYKNMKIELAQQLLMLSDYEVICQGNNIFNELITYRWDKNRPVAVYGDHAIDAMRYAAIALIRSY